MILACIGTKDGKGAIHVELPDDPMEYRYLMAIIDQQALARANAEKAKAQKG